MFSKFIFATLVTHDTPCVLTYSQYRTFISSEEVQEKKTRKHDGRLYNLVISRSRFRVNQHPIVAWMSRNSLTFRAKSEV